MNTFTKLFISLFAFVGSILLFCALIRLVNGKSAFVGISDLYYYFQDIDIYKPFKKLLDYLDNLKEEFLFDIKNTDLLNFRVDSFSDIFKAIGYFFTYIGNVFVDIFKFIGLPFYLSYYLMEFVITLFGSFFSFIGNVLT